MDIQSTSKVKSLQIIILIITISLIAISVLVYKVIKTQALLSTKEKQLQQVSTPQIKTVTALGRLEPKGEVIKLSAPTMLSQGSRLEKILVEEGDKVKAGQVIAILDNRNKLQAAYEKTKEAVQVSRANLAKIKAGAKIGEIDAQKAEIARIQVQSLGEERAQRETVFRLEAQWQGDRAVQLAAIRKIEAELNNAKSEYNRYEQLYKEGVVPQSNFDSKRLRVDTLIQQLSEAKADFKRINSTGNRQIQEAKVVLSRIQATSNKQIMSAEATLNKISEIRPVDIAVADAEFRQAIAAQKEAKANLEEAFVKAPANGVIFKINTYPGETVSNNGIVEFGKVDQMVVIAEVYQSHIKKIRLGQKVRVTSNTFNGELYGQVDLVGWQIQRQNIINSDPSDNIDSRVVEVRVKLDEASSKKAAKLTNLQVKTIFHL